MTNPALLRDSAAALAADSARALEIATALATRRTLLLGRLTAADDAHTAETWSSDAATTSRAKLAAVHRELGTASLTLASIITDLGAAADELQVESGRLLRDAEAAEAEARAEQARVAAATEEARAALADAGASTAHTP